MLVKKSDYGTYTGKPMLNERIIRSIKNPGCKSADADLSPLKRKYIVRYRTPTHNAIPEGHVS